MASDDLHARYKISTSQAHSQGNIIGSAIVERLDRIVELLERVARDLGPTEFIHE